MRTITESYNVYKFEELTKEVQEKVIDRDRYYEVNEENFWSECIIEYWQEKLENIGFINSKIYFSGFSSQGDGACFDATVDLQVISNIMFYNSTDYKEARLWRSINIAAYNDRIENPTIYTINHHYSHENTRRINSPDIYLQECFFVDDIENAIVEHLESLRYRLCIEIYRELEKEYDYLTSDDYVRSYYSENQDIEFTQDGELY